MDIKDLRKETEQVLFQDVSLGSVYEIRGNFYMKTFIASSTKTIFNCINLKEGTLHHTSIHTIIKPLKAVLSIDTYV